MVFHKRKRSIGQILFVKDAAIIDILIDGGNANGQGQGTFRGKGDCD